MAAGLGLSALVYLGWHGVPWAVADEATPPTVSAPAQTAEAGPLAPSSNPRTCAEWAALTAGKGPAIVQMVNGQPVARVYVTTCSDDESGIRLTISGG